MSNTKFVELVKVDGRTKYVEVSKEEILKILTTEGVVYDYTDNKSVCCYFQLVNGKIEKHKRNYGQTFENQAPIIHKIYDNDPGSYIRITKRIAVELKDGMTVDELRDVIEKVFTVTKIDECREKRPFLSKRPKYKFDLKEAGLIYCELPLMSKYANVEFVKRNYDKIIRYAIDDIKNTTTYRNSELTLNYFKVGRATLRNDDVLDIVFELKIAS